MYHSFLSYTLFNYLSLLCFCINILVFRHVHEDSAFHPRGLFSSKITGYVSRVFNPSSVPCPSRFPWGWPVERPPYHHAEVTWGKMWARVDDSAVQLHLKEEASVHILQFEIGVKEVKCPLWSTITERDWSLRTSALRTRQAFPQVTSTAQDSECIWADPILSGWEPTDVFILFIILLFFTCVNMRKNRSQLRFK